jgi:hypothetical protein
MQITGAARRFLGAGIMMTTCVINRAKSNISQNDHGIHPHTTLDAIGGGSELFLTVGGKITICHKLDDTEHHPESQPHLTCGNEGANMQ